MPIIKSAKKKVRVDKRRQAVNDRIEAALNRSVVLFKKSPTRATLSAVFSKLDRAVKKKVIHKNKASRGKSRYATYLENSTKATKTPSRTSVPSATKTSSKKKGK